MKHPETNHIPFESLESTDHAGDFFRLNEVEKNPNLVVKNLDIYEFPTKEEISVITKSIQDFIGLTQESSLKEFMPRSQVVIGENMYNHPNAYVIAEKINGAELGFDETEREYKLSTEDKQRLYGLLNAFIEIYIKTFNGTRGKTLEFQGAQNYLKGINLARPEGEKIYFIDQWPIYDATIQEFKAVSKVFGSRFGLDYKKILSMLDDLELSLERRAA
ncbi:MAG TPA: hypothetical protein VL306_02550 [Methylomirabilota bacterium]|jgi:hypothetical protein|nr:hypothetical protein [Methylomirabilota bacterium]